MRLRVRRGNTGRDAETVTRGIVKEHRCNLVMDAAEQAFTEKAERLKI
jgi:hypothetical protein